MTNRKRKILLIGTSGYERNRDDVSVKCCKWPKVMNIKNFRDFDSIIFDLVSVGSDENHNTIPWEELFSRFDFSGAMDILMNNGSFIIVGDPRFHVKLMNENGKEIKVPFLHWTGIKFSWDSEPGDTLVFKDEYQNRPFEGYITNLNSWKYSLSSCNLDTKKLEDRFNMKYLRENGMKMQLDKDFICSNRYANALVFRLRYELVKERYNSTAKVQQSYGPIIFLPENSSPHDEIIQQVLTDICGVETELPEPEWISRFTAPGQTTIDDEIEEIEAKILSANQELELANKRRAKIRNCLKLLYEREFALEPAVHDILRGLGATVEEPKEKNKEDGWIAVKIGDTTYEGVLEIKSTRSDTFGENGRKQLLDWIDRGRTLRQKAYKGIFIGNSAVDKPINERKNAFPDNWIKSAELSQICAFKTVDLYLFHILKSRGLIDLSTLWKEIFETNGILEVQQYWDALKPKEEAPNEKQDNPTNQ